MSPSRCPTSPPVPRSTARCWGPRCPSRWRSLSHGVTTVFIELPNTKVELITPLGDTSPIRGFLERNPFGGIHHICYEVSDVRAAARDLAARGARILGDAEPKIGAHGKPVIFVHPKDFLGTLIELEQA